MEFEERNDQPDRIFNLLARLIQIPMHQYARYFERYRQMAPSKPIAALVPPQILTQLQMEVENEGLGYKAGRNETEVERELRGRIDNLHLASFQKNQTEVTKRWTYESEIKRPYFHVTDLDESQLANWRKYLDFEESEGDYTRIQFLYERCLVTCAQHEEFWLRYARWMLAQTDKDEEVRIIYQRASCLFVPIALPTTRLQYAYFEEMSDRVDVAKDIHEAILVQLPSHIETIVSLANTCRRHGTVDDAIAVYQNQVQIPSVESSAKAAVVSEWARLVWKIKGTPDEARQLFVNNKALLAEVEAFWKGYLQFEIGQNATRETEKDHHDLIKKVADEILQRKSLPETAIKALMGVYMEYLLERGSKDAAKEYLNLDREINGPLSVRNLKAK